MASDLSISPSCVCQMIFTSQRCIPRAAKKWCHGHAQLVVQPCRALRYFALIQNEAQVLFGPRRLYSNDISPWEIWILGLSRRPPKVIRRTFVCGIESFSTDDGYGSENVTLKMNSRFFKLLRIYSSSLEMSKVGEFSWSWFLGTALKFRKREKNSSSLVYASTKREIMHFHVVLVQRRYSSWLVFPSSFGENSFMVSIIFSWEIS